MSGRGKRNAEDSDEEYTESRAPIKRSKPRQGAASKKQSTVDEPERMRDNSMLILKRDHESRPIWVTRDNMILLEAFSPIYQQTYDFLVAISEPEARPEFIHRYRLTQNSLYAAVAIAIDTDTIIRVLDKLCKTELPRETVQFIRDSTRTFGKAKLVLKDNQYFVESLYPEVLKELLKHESIKKARITEEDVFEEAAAPMEDAKNTGYRSILDLEEDTALLENPAAHNKRTVSFKIKQDCAQIVKKHALDGYAPYIARYPLIEEYDFRNDAVNPVLNIDLRPSTKIRPYQEKSLGKMFGNGRARSGLIVLPCGAGKSLTGVTVSDRCLIYTALPGAHSV